MPNTFFESVFMECLLEQFWKQCQKSIIIRQFLPYCLFVIATIWHMRYALDDSKPEEPWEMAFGIISLLGVAYFILTEIKQFLSYKSKLMYCTFWNIVDIIALSLTLVVEI